MVINVMISPTEALLKWDHDFERNLMNLLGPIFVPNDKCVIDRSVNLTFFWKDQCNLQFSPELLEYLSDNLITLCVSTQENECGQC